jgi:hypothetical protein
MSSLIDEDSTYENIKTEDGTFGILKKLFDISKTKKLSLILLNGILNFITTLGKNNNNYKVNYIYLKINSLSPFNCNIFING